MHRMQLIIESNGLTNREVLLCKCQSLTEPHRYSGNRDDKIDCIAIYYTQKVAMQFKLAVG